mmetsp:Transcript_61724/g.108109  ORF Transcript_61724/g.108109 Transcript_61724/m.108109 type:complete len:361 (+) Transcript_61724:24-1106(+)
MCYSKTPQSAVDMAHVSIRSIEKAKLQRDESRCYIETMDDDEVCHIPHYSELSRPQQVDLFAETIAGWLSEAYKLNQLPLMRTQTHTGTSSNSVSPAPPQDEQGGIAAQESGRPYPAIARTQSSEPALELEAKPFFERSSIFFRLKPPSKWGRGYNRGQPFKTQDMFCWQRIRDYDWSMIVDDALDVLVFINHWFECDFTWGVLEHMFSLNPSEAAFDDLIAGDGHMGSVVKDGCVDSPLAQEVQWSCKVCKDYDGNPTLNTALVQSHTDGVLFRHDFCRTCRTYRYDQDVWLCLGPPRSTWPRTKSKPCLRAVRMQASPLSIPCCRACETVRHDFHKDEIFELFSNAEDEPMPEKMLRV